MEKKKLETKTAEEISDELDAFENYLHMKYGAILVDEIPKGETESAEMKRKKTWVSVDALKQWIEKSKVVCWAANGDEIEMYWRKTVRLKQEIAKLIEKYSQELPETLAIVSDLKELLRLLEKRGVEN